jgi:Fe-S cluster biogenesis protein NfuA
MIDQKMFDKINSALENIKPYLQADGGDISLVEVTDDYIVRVKLHGACGCCPFSMQTLKSGVEDTLKREIPEIKEVQAV